MFFYQNQNLHFLSRWSNTDQIYTPTWNNKTEQQKKEIAVLKILDISWWKAVLFKGWGKKLTSIITSVYCLRKRMSRLQCKQQHRQVTNSPPELRKQTGESKDANMARVWSAERRKLNKERNQNIWREFFLITQQSPGHSIFVRKLQVKEPQKRKNGKVIQAHTDLAIECARVSNVTNLWDL